MVLSARPEVNVEAGCRREEVGAGEVQLLWRSSLDLVIVPTLPDLGSGCTDRCIGRETQVLPWQPPALLLRDVNLLASLEAAFASRRWGVLAGDAPRRLHCGEVPP